jgi:hypothetical protein
MPTPTTNLKMSDIQAEFGGSNPISLSEYYRGGVNVQSGTATSATDGTAISASGLIRVGMFRGVSAATVTSFGGQYSRFRVGAQCQAIITANTDGTFFGSGTGNSSIDTVTSDLWHTSVVANIGNSRWVRATFLSGDTLTSGSLNVWSSMSSSQSWSNLSTAGSTGQRSTSFRLDFSSSSSGNPIVGTGNISLNASHEP